MIVLVHWWGEGECVCVCVCILFLHYHIAVSILPPIEPKSVGGVLHNMPVCVHPSQLSGPAKVGKLVLNLVS